MKNQTFKDYLQDNNIKPHRGLDNEMIDIIMHHAELWHLDEAGKMIDRIKEKI